MRGGRKEVQRYKPRLLELNRHSFLKVADVVITNITLHPLKLNIMRNAM